MKGKKTNKNKQIKEIKKTFNELISSLKDKKNIWVISYDLCFLLIAGIILKASSNILAKQISRLGISPTSLGPETIARQLGAIKTLAAITIITAVITYILIIIAYSFFRGWAWTKLQNKKPTKKYITRFILLNLTWITAWTALLIITTNIVHQEYYIYLMITGTIAYIHLTTVLHHSFTYHEQIKKAISKAFTIGIGKIQQFIIPYIYIIIIYIILTKILIIIPIKARTIATTAVIILFLAWYKTYMNRTITRAQKKRQI